MSDRYCCVACTNGTTYVVNESYEEVTKSVVYESEHGVLTSPGGIDILARHVVAYWEEEP